MEITFDDLLRQVPRGPGPDRLPLVPADGFGYVEHSIPGFVPPRLRDRGDLPLPARDRVVIVSASGAVGKSTLARQLAFSACAPYWDLSAARPSSANALLGVIQRCFGVTGTAEVYSRVAAGQMCFVIDALDEARMKTTDAGFEALLHDVAEIAKASPSTSFILLGRSQVAETAWLVLEEAGVPSRLLSILPFNKEERDAYIALAIDRSRPSWRDEGEGHRRPVTEARDLVISQLEQALTGVGSTPREVVEAFIGYAPVLDAVGVMLATASNPLVLINQLRAELQSANQSHMSVLLRVVRHILEREQLEKFVPNLTRRVGDGAFQAEGIPVTAIYGELEQCCRLAAKWLRIDSGLRDAFSPLFQAEKDQAVASLLGEHPFLRDGTTPINAVFENYLLVIVLLRGPGHLSRAVEAHLSRVSTATSPFFLEFYLELARGEPFQSVPADHLGWLVDSALAADSSIARARVAIEGADPGMDDSRATNALAEVEFEWQSNSMKGWFTVRRESLPTDLGRDSRVHLPNGVRNTTIITPGTVLMGRPGAEASIGTSVSITCRELSILGTDLVVGSLSGSDERQDELGGVYLEAHIVHHEISNRPIVRTQLTLKWPGAVAYPWHEFAIQGELAGVGDRALGDAYRRFRRIVMTLQSHGRGSLARTSRKIEHERVMGGVLGRALLEQLILDGILELHDGFYFWIPGIASELVGVSWLDLREYRMSEKLKQYLRAFTVRYGGHFSG